MVGGFVVLFSVIISIFHKSQLLHLLADCIQPFFDLLHIKPTFSTGFISGILELTNGLNIISNIPEKKLSINILIASFLLGFGGFSILLQVWSSISKTDLSIKPYILGKLLQACFSVFYTYIFLQNITFFNFNL